MSLCTSRAGNGAEWKRPGRETTYKNPNKTNSEVENQKKIEVKWLLIPTPSSGFQLKSDCFRSSNRLLL